MSQRLDDTLQAALDALSAGEPLESVLSHFPDMADDLRPLLAAAAAISRLDAKPDSTRQAESKRRFLSMAAQSPARRPAPGFLIRSLAGGLVALALVIAALLGSTSSLPGEPLYAVKRSIETARLALAPDGVSRAEIESDLQQERVKEVSALLERGQTANIELTGVWSSPRAGVWSVSGLTVTLADSVSLPDGLQSGTLVKISGRVENHALIVTHISLIGDPPSQPAPTPVPGADDDEIEDASETPEPDEIESEVEEHDKPDGDPDDGDKSGPGGGDSGDSGDSGESDGDDD